MSDNNKIIIPVEILEDEETNTEDADKRGN